MNTKLLLLGWASIWCAGWAGASDISNPAIGIVVSYGDFQIDGYRARGNGTVLNGTTIDNLKSPTHVSLTNGTRLDLAPEAQSQVFADRLILKKGIVQVWPAAGFAVVANGLRVQSDGASSNFRVWRNDEMSISVTSITGTAVALGTHIGPGETRKLSSVSGSLERDGSHYRLRDETTELVVEVRGPDVAGQVGHLVRISGVVDITDQPIPGAWQLLDEIVLTAIPGKSAKHNWSKSVAIGSGVAAAAGVGFSSQALFTGGAAAGISPGQ